MNYNEKVFSEQFPLIKKFIYHVVYYKELFDLYEKIKLESVFWSNTIDAHVL